MSVYFFLSFFIGLFVYLFILFFYLGGNRTNKILKNSDFWYPHVVIKMFQMHFILLGFLYLFLLSTTPAVPELQLQQNMTGSTLYYCVVVD